MFYACFNANLSKICKTPCNSIFLKIWTKVGTLLKSLFNRSSLKHGPVSSLPVETSRFGFFFILDLNVLSNENFTGLQKYQWIGLRLRCGHQEYNVNLSFPHPVRGKGHFNDSYSITSVWKWPNSMAALKDGSGLYIFYIYLFITSIIQIIHQLMLGCFANFATYLSNLLLLLISASNFCSNFCS
jgi:hypothetical protein